MKLSSCGILQGKERDRCCRWASPSRGSWERVESTQGLLGGKSYKEKGRKQNWAGRRRSDLTASQPVRSSAPEITVGRALPEGKWLGLFHSPRWGWPRLEQRRQVLRELTAGGCWAFPTAGQGVVCWRGLWATHVCLPPRGGMEESGRHHRREVLTSLSHWSGMKMRG